MHRASAAQRSLIAIGQRFYARGWVLGTSGNFSAVIRREPLVLTITATGLDKGTLVPEQFVRINASGTVVEGSDRPSAETALHLLLAKVQRAGAVLHTHSVWSTIISELYGNTNGLWIEGYEMLKGLNGVKSHTHREWLPIIENDQDMARLAGVVEAELARRSEAHGFLLLGTGFTLGARVPSRRNGISRYWSSC